MVTLTVDANRKLTCNQDYLAAQGEEATITVAVDSSLIVAGQVAYVDFYLPDGGIVQKGQYDYSSSFDVEIGATDIILDRDGVCQVKVVLATVSGTTRTEVSATNKLKLPILDSILPESGIDDGTDGTELYAPEKTVYQTLWLGGGSQWILNRINPTTAATVGQYACDVQILAGDGEYLYGQIIDDDSYNYSTFWGELTTGTTKLYKINSNAQTIVETDMHDTAARCAQTMYVYGNNLYVSTIKTGDHRIQKYQKNSLDYITQTDAMGDVFAVAMQCDGTYLYALVNNTDINGVVGIYKYNISDMSLVDSATWQTTDVKVDYSYFPFPFPLELYDGNLYLCGWLDDVNTNTSRIYKIATADLSISASHVMDVANTYGIGLAQDGTSLYCQYYSAFTPHAYGLLKLALADLSLTTSAVRSSVTVNGTCGILYQSVDEVPRLYETWANSKIKETNPATLAIRTAGTAESQFITAYYPTKPFYLDGVTPVADVNIVINEDKTASIDRSYLGVKGEEVTVGVTVDSDLGDMGYDAYMDFLLPNGTAYWRGPYDCSSSYSFTFTIGASDAIVTYDGVILWQFVLAVTADDGSRDIKWCSRTYQSRVLDSVTALSS